MLIDTAFHLSAWLVMPFWIVMILVPHHPFTRKIVGSPWIIVPPIFCYLAIFFGPVGFLMYALVRCFTSQRAGQRKSENVDSMRLS